MSTFKETRVAITRTGTLNGVTVEFTTVDGSNEVSGTFRDEATTIGSFSFSPGNKSINVHSEDVSDIDFESVLDLVKSVDSFISSQS